MKKKWEDLTSQKKDLQSYRDFFLANRIDYEIKKLVEYYIDRSSGCIEFAHSFENNFLDNFSNYILNRRY